MSLSKFDLVMVGFEPMDEQWPNDVILYQPFEAEQILLPDMADCLSVRAFLKMAQLDFRVEFKSNAEFMSPNGKLPFIITGNDIKSGLIPIIEFAESKGIVLSEKLENAQKSDMLGYMCLVKTVLGNAETYKVWCDSTTLPLSYERYGSVYPFPLNYLLSYYKKTCCQSSLRASGWLNKTMQEVCSEVDKCCKALSDRLKKQDYFFETPTQLDALVFGHIYSIITTFLPQNDLAPIIRSYSNLIDHCERIDNLYFKYERISGSSD